MTCWYCPEVWVGLSVWAVQVLEALAYFDDKKMIGSICAAAVVISGCIRASSVYLLSEYRTRASKVAAWVDQAV